MTRNRNNPLRPLIIVFVVLNGLIIAGKNFMDRQGIDREVVIIGNCLLFLLSLASLFLSRRALKSDNPNVSVRAMYTNVMLKLFVCIAAAFIYFSMAKPNVNKPALFICMALYIVYTVIEVSTVTKILQRKKNA